jgi:hypothetical protein
MFHSGLALWATALRRVEVPVPGELDLFPVVEHPPDDGRGRGHQMREA